MDRRTIYIIFAVVVVVLIAGYSLGWFRGSAPPTATMAPAPAAPPAATVPAPAVAPVAPSAPAQPAAPAQ